MFQRPDQEYHVAREAQHRAMAAQAGDERARRSHAEIATLHMLRAREVATSHRDG